MLLVINTDLLRKKANSKYWSYSIADTKEYLLALRKTILKKTFITRG